MEWKQPLPKMALRYDPTSGALSWKHRPREAFPCQRSFATWNCRFSGKPALNRIGVNGYRYGSLFGKTVTAHRIIWEIMRGEKPNGLIDHIDGDRTNNRWANLRLVTAAENARNYKLSRNNTSGFSGVHRCKYSESWIATIMYEGKLRNLHNSPCIAAAAISRHIEERNLGYVVRQ